MVEVKNMIYADMQDVLLPDSDEDARYELEKLIEFSSKPYGLQHNIYDQIAIVEQECTPGGWFGPPSRSLTIRFKDWC